MFALFRDESHIDFRTQSVIMTLGGGIGGGGGGAITNGVMKFRKIIEFQSSEIVMNCFYNIYFQYFDKNKLLRMDFS